jgi:hypothetical protein
MAESLSSWFFVFLVVRRHRRTGRCEAAWRQRRRALERLDRRPEVFEGAVRGEVEQGAAVIGTIPAPWPGENG